ncbi:MAG: glycoside hydrolase family 3 protein [Armatimonadota bacterium]
MATPDFQKIIDNMTLDQKIGQMFMGDIAGGESLDLAKSNFETYHFGALQYSGVFEIFTRGGNYLPCGVCRNFPLDEVAKFLADIKQAAFDIMGVPAIIAGDQEGSISNSILRRRNIAMMPSQMGLGAAGSLEGAYQAALVSAKEVKTIGLDMLYGPSLDVLTSPQNPEIGARSFSGDPETVAAMGEQFIKAYAVQNVISNVKHFPGRGHGKGDAHKALESIDLSRSDMEKLALLPFRRAIAAGVDSFMIAHTLFPALETERLPASLSPRIVQGLLRDEMGFDGLVIPDDLSMFAISDNFGIPQASAMCLEAGADMVFTKVSEQYAPTIAAIKESIRAGRLTEERVNQSLLRILRLKHKRGLFTPPSFSAEHVLATIGCPEHVAVARNAARHAVLVLKNRNGLLPLRPSAGQTLLAITPRDLNVVLSNDETLSHDMLPKALGRHFAGVQQIIIDEAPTEHQSYEAFGRSKNVDIIIFGIYSAGASEGQLALLKNILGLGKPVIVVITNSPWAATLLPESTAAVVCGFGISPFAFEAVADTLAGALTPTAKLPVGLNAEMPEGFAVSLAAPVA